MTEQKKNEVAKATKNGVAAPAAQTGRGFENVDMSDISMPRAKLLQSNNPEVSDRDYDFRAGDVIHSLLMEKLADRFIPLSIWNSNILFVPRDADKKKAFKDALSLTDDEMDSTLICRAEDGKTGTKYGNCAKCGKNKFNGNEKPLCMQTINVLCAPLDDDDTLGMPVVLQFSSTSYKHGKKFRDSAFYSSATSDLFSKIYKLAPEQKQAGGNSWYELKTKPAGKVPDALKKEAEDLYTAFAGRRIVVDAEDDGFVENKEDIPF